MNDLSTTSALDGFEVDDESGSSLIKGAKIKFTLDFKWVIARTGEVIDPRREFLIIDILRVAQKWLPGHSKPAETRILAPGEKFPDLKKLNKDAPQPEWRDKFGKRVGPWEAAHVVYLLEDAKKVAVFTWVADIDTAGASRAIKDLRETTQLTRQVRGQMNLRPLVSLSDTFMPTQFGGRQRPHFNILDYVALGSLEKPTLTATEPKQIEAKPAEGAERKGNNRAAQGAADKPKAPAKSANTATDPDDEIPF